MSTVANGSSGSMLPHTSDSAENHEGGPVTILGDVSIPDATRSGDSPPLKSGGGVALGILATASVIFTLNWAQGLVISLLLGVIFAYTLNPVVVWLERIKIPRVVGAGIVMMAVVCALLFGAYSLRGEMQNILTQLPTAMSKLSVGLASMRNVQNDNMQKIQNAASDMEKSTSSPSGIPSNGEQNAMHVVVDAPAFKLGNFLWAGSKGILGFLGQAAMVVFLAFFLLLASGTFKRKLVRLTGPSLSRRKITVHILDDINSSIQRYMLMLLLTNVLVSLLAWLVFRWIGLENSGAWAVAAGMLHIVPYFGPGITAVATGMASFLQFNSLSMVLLVSGASLAIATLVGTFITTWMTGRIAKMNTAAVFISLLFWSWLWGVWGMLLSMPIIVIVKVVSQYVGRLRTVSELLGE
jgi:predicted PurR-regulated permease PerM